MKKPIFTHKTAFNKVLIKTQGSRILGYVEKIGRTVILFHQASTDTFFCLADRYSADERSDPYGYGDLLSSEIIVVSAARARKTWSLFSNACKLPFYRAFPDLLNYPVHPLAA